MSVIRKKSVDELLRGFDRANYHHFWGKTPKGITLEKFGLLDVSINRDAGDNVVFSLSYVCADYCMSGVILDLVDGNVHLASDSLECRKVTLKHGSKLHKKIQGKVLFGVEDQKIMEIEEHKFKKWFYKNDALRKQLLVLLEASRADETALLLERFNYSVRALNNAAVSNR